MLGPFDYVLWLFGFALEVYIAVSALARREFVRYLSVNLYMLAAALQTASLFIVYRQYGFSSLQYRYLYYYSDSLLTVLMFLVVMELYHHVFSEMGVSKHIKGATVLLLAVTAAFSYLVVHSNARNLTSRFVVELGQNLYFVGVVLTYLLWGAVLKLRETRTRLVQLVLSLGIYFSATAAAFALRNMFPAFQSIKAVGPLAGGFLALAWAFAFTKIPEEARLVTAQVAVPHR